jgi:hypothetical protein
MSYSANYPVSLFTQMTSAIFNTVSVLDYSRTLLAAVRNESEVSPESIRSIRETHKNQSSGELG